MRPEARLVCGSCPHPGALHLLPVGKCHVNGCHCDRFMDPSKPPNVDGDEERTLVIRIPEGYAVTVQLVPMAAAEEAPDGA